jgi:hypothetical protein
MSEYNIPRSQLDVVKNIIIGWYRAGADTEPQSNGDVEDFTSISKSTVSRQNKFLTELGILQEDGRKRRLTESGIELAEALAKGDSIKAKEKMRSILDEWALTERFYSIVDMSGPMAEDEMEQELASITGREREGRSATGLSTLVSLYEWAGFFEYDENKEEYRALPKPERPSTEQSEPSQKKESASQTDGSDHQSETSSTSVERVESDFPIQISVEISGDDDPANVEELIKSIRRGLNASLFIEEEGESESPKQISLTSEFDS